MAEDVIRVNALEKDTHAAFEAAAKEMMQKPSKNGGEGMEQKLHSLKITTFQALQSIKNKIWKGHLKL